VGDVAEADVWGRKVSAQLLGLHPLPPLEPAAEAHVDVAVAAVNTVVAEPSRPGDQLLAHHAAALALQAQEAGLAVTVAHAALPLPPPVQWHACAHRCRLHIDADGSLAAVLVACALLLEAGVLLLHLVRNKVLHLSCQNFGLPQLHVVL